MSILSRVQANPSIGQNNPEYVADLVERAKDFIVAFCNLKFFPEFSAGYTVSGEGAEQDITFAETNSLLVKVNKSPFMEIHLDLSNCTSGDDTASELQSAIQAASNSYGFPEVTAFYDSTAASYTILSGRQGDYSCVQIRFNDTESDVGQLLNLSPEFGAFEFYGSYSCKPLEDAAVMLAEAFYRKLGLEGISQGSIPGGISFSEVQLDPKIQSILLRYRRL